MRNPCKDCIYYHKENRTCQSKKCATGGSGKVSWIDKLFCSPCKKDGRPVEVHGHWISLTDCSNAGVYCSICHKKVYKEDYAWCNRKNKLRSPYCPNCGAKMDGGAEG